MVKLSKEELNSLVGKTIYRYYLKNPLDYCFAESTKINVSQLEIYKAYEEDPSCETSKQYVCTKDYKTNWQERFLKRMKMKRTYADVVR